MSKELGETLPELYLHGLAKDYFELALRSLLGEGAPLSASSIQRLKAKWQNMRNGRERIFLVLRLYISEQMVSI